LDENWIIERKVFLLHRKWYFNLKEQQFGMGFSTQLSLPFPKHWRQHPKWSEHSLQHLRTIMWLDDL